MLNRTYHALIVDDEWTTRQLTKNALCSVGIVCHFAGNGQQALDSLGKTDYDIVITDLMMPEFNGHQLCLMLLKFQRPPVIIVHTGVTDPKIGADLLRRGVDDIEFKPVDYRAFTTKVETLLTLRDSSKPGFDF